MKMFGKNKLLKKRLNSFVNGDNHQFVLCLVLTPLCPKSTKVRTASFQGCLLAADETDSRDVLPLCTIPTLQDLQLGGSWFAEGCFVVTETKTNAIREANGDGRELL